MSLRGLYAITDSQLLANGKLLPYVEAALAGGARLLQYRDKSGDNAKRRQEAGQLQQLCERYHCQLLINDDLELAAELGVGLHLGREDGSIQTARQRLGPDALIGATCHDNLGYAHDALAAGASYVAFGRFFSSTTKPGAPTASLNLLHTAAEQLTAPIVAIGGVTLTNAPQLVAAGADLVAVVHGLFGVSSAAEVERRARAFTTLLPL